MVEQGQEYDHVGAARTCERALGMSSAEGATSVEYALLVGLIAVAIIGSVGALGASIFTDEQTEMLGQVLGGEDPAVVVPPPSDDPDPADAGKPCPVPDHANGKPPIC
jgi:Flp pilus assembly pilin Flp